MHPLDRPAWNALTTFWAPYAQGSAAAWRLEPEHGIFATAAEDVAAIVPLIPPGGSVALIEPEPIAPPPGTRIERQAVLHQMVADVPVLDGPVPDFVDLGDADAPAMLALATATEPGPFYARTHRLGRFIGVQEGGRLLAMSGERMRVPGFTEVSAVCTDPAARGRGYAAGLMREGVRRIVARGEVPFLHTYPDNAGAVRIYEALGFRLRRPMVLTILVRE